MNERSHIPVTARSASSSSQLFVVAVVAASARAVPAAAGVDHGNVASGVAAVAAQHCRSSPTTHSWLNLVWIRR